MDDKLKNSCPFCETFPSDLIVAKNQRFVAKYDLYPVSIGHTLLIPKRHISSLFEITEEELLDFYHLLHEVQQTLIQKHSPDGFNLGVNIGRVAGQTIPHLHIHLIPRYAGDVDHPEGGIRNLIPNLVSYPIKNHNQDG